MTPSDRVTQFVASMADWERKTYSVMTSGSVPGEQELAPARASLHTIYDEHLTERAKGPEKWGMRLTALAPSSPPQYDQELTGTEDGPKPSVAYVLARHRVATHKSYRYSVVLDAKGKPLIDDIRVAYVEGGDWKRCPY